MLYKYRAGKSSQYLESWSGCYLLGTQPTIQANTTEKARKTSLNLPSLIYIVQRSRLINAILDGTAKN